MKPDDDDPNKKPVRDHCHVTGKYRGSAHLICNNLKGYDSHFLIQKIDELINEGEAISIKVIPCNAEKYMAFYINKHLNFIDSFQFMSSSLARLADNLPVEGFTPKNILLKRDNLD